MRLSQLTDDAMRLLIHLCLHPGRLCTIGGTLAGSCKRTGVMDGAPRSFIDHLDRRTLADILAAPAGREGATLVRVHRRAAGAPAR